jgi:hypothetical protein
MIFTQNSPASAKTALLFAEITRHAGEEQSNPASTN